MQATVRTRFGQIVVEGDDQRELFKAMSGAYEVFDEAKCGLCGCERIRPVTRKNKDEEEFHEYRCLGTVDRNGKKEACGAYLYLGQNKKGGGLFPVRALIENLVGGKPGPEHGKPDREKGKFGSHRGWTRYRGEPKEAGKK